MAQWWSGLTSYGPRYAKRTSQLIANDSKYGEKGAWNCMLKAQQYKERNVALICLTVDFFVAMIAAPCDIRMVSDMNTITIVIAHSAFLIGTTIIQILQTAPNLIIKQG